MGGLKSWFVSQPNRAYALGLFVLAAALVIVVGFEAGLMGAQPIATAESSPEAPPSMTAAATSLGGSLAAATPSDTPAPTAFSTPTPTPTAPPLPALLGAIGDSYSQAFSVAPAYLLDHTQFSWVIGTDHRVFSLAERFGALGGSPALMDAATSGKKMNDATRQAMKVVAAAKKLSPGQTAYVTFELGTNDLCDDPMTDPAAFESELRSAVSILRAGLPAGSRILMMSVPDFSHLRDITQADPAARANLALFQNSTRCAPFLGDNTHATLSQAEADLRLYDASLVKVCDEIAAADAATGKLYCTSNQALLSLRDFRIADLSTVDYFHPSLTGQAKIADAAWAADIWSSAPLPSGAAAVAPAERGIGAAPPVTALPLALPLIGPRAARRRRHRPQAPGAPPGTGRRG